MCLEARTPAVIWWGRERVLLHNDAHLALLDSASRHAALGQRGRAAWPAAWPALEPILDAAWAADACGSWTVEHDVLCQADGLADERVLTFTYVPIRDEGGALRGVLGFGTDVTPVVVMARRLQLLEHLCEATLAAETPSAACQRAAEVLAGFSNDIPFALFYLRDASPSALGLAAVAGIQPPAGLAASDGASMALSADELRRADGVVLDLDTRAVDGAGVRVGTCQAYVRTIGSEEDDGQGDGCLVMGLSPRRPFDGDVRRFLDGIASRMSQALRHARDRETARAAMLAVAEADGRRAALLGRLAHELRTPLNAILGWAQVLDHGIAAPEIAKKGLDAIQRNAWRQKHALDALAMVTTATPLAVLPVPRTARLQDPADALQGARILVVDDEPDVRTLLRHVLAEAGADTVLAASVEEALESVLRQPPDLIVSDIGLPGESGYELIRRVRALPADSGGLTPALALTASTGPDDATRALDAGFAIHLQKPVDRQQLLSACAHLLRRRRAGR